MGVTVGSSIGSAHIGAKAATTYDSKSKQFEATGKAHIGLGAGVKIGFMFTNSEQKIYSSKKK